MFYEALELSRHADIHEELQEGLSLSLAYERDQKVKLRKQQLIAYITELLSSPYIEFAPVGELLLNPQAFWEREDLVRFNSIV